jgi:hypothetical protein
MRHDRNSFLTLTQAAAAMGVSVSALSRRRSLGHFPRFVKEPDSCRWLITIADLESDVGPIADAALDFALRPKPRKPKPAPKRYSEKQLEKMIQDRDRMWIVQCKEQFGQVVEPPT